MHTIPFLSHRLSILLIPANGEKISRCFLQDGNFNQADGENQRLEKGSNFGVILGWSSHLASG